MPSEFTPAHRGGSGPPLVCVHGFTDTWRTWELMLPELERSHDVLAPTLVGHAGAPPIEGAVGDDTLVEGVERAMDAAGFTTAHIVGNSLGGFVSLQLAARGRAESVMALAPAGGWAPDDEAFGQATAAHFRQMRELTRAAAPHIEELVSTPAGRRAATQFTTVNYEHIPAELIAHQTLGVAGCEAMEPLLEHALAAGWTLDAQRIACPVRIVWGSEDALLPWPSAAVRFRDEWLPDADWVTLDGVGHCPQLDVPAQAARLILGFASG
jgi:pimeloyl-ACP methyl ester carboxylesterase